MKTALVIIDLQNDFLAPDGAYARGGCANPEAQRLPAHLLPVAPSFRSAHQTHFRLKMTQPLHLFTNMELTFLPITRSIVTDIIDT